MNLQLTPILPPIKVLVTNAITPTGKLVMYKIVSGNVFGEDQKIDLIMSVSLGEKLRADLYKIELESCGFDNTNSITISYTVPRLTDADVFCFIVKFPNPNIVSDQYHQNLNSSDVIESFDLLTKISYNFHGPLPEPPKKIDELITKKMREQIRREEKAYIKPIILMDGLVALDILKSLSKDIPSDVFFCPTPLSVVAKAVLGDYLKVNCKEINDSFIWAANDRVFNVEFMKPILLNDDIVDRDLCDSDLISKDKLRSLKFDHTQFGPSWMKKEFPAKVVSAALKNPYGYVYKASEIANTLRSIWKARSKENGIKVCANIGVISDGSMETIKGLPYVLPLILCGDSWKVDQQLKDDPHLKLEIKRINKEVEKNHEIIKQICKSLTQENSVVAELEESKDDSEYSY